jgi:biopolymer transport protein ExbB
MVRVVAVISIVSVLFLLMAPVAFAQEEGGGEAQSKSWFELFKATGIVGIMLLGLSIAGTALLIQYMVTLTEPKIANMELLAEIEERLMDGDVEGATAVAEGDASYSGRVMAGALRRYDGNNIEDVKEGMLEAAETEGFRLNAKLSYLALVGNIGPLLGLLGTVTGMISSFQVIETLAAPTPKDLAVGVYESLVNTTMGLFIAIIFLTAFFFLKNKVSTITLKVNGMINDMLSQALKQAAAPAAKPAAPRR